MSFKLVCKSCKFFKNNACEEHRGYPADDGTLKRGGGMCPDFKLRDNIGLKKAHPTEAKDRWICDACGEELEYSRGKRPPICPNPVCSRKGAFIALSGPFKYFDGQKFVPKRLADEIAEENRFATNRDSWVLYRYHEGCYKPDGEALIRERCREKLRELSKEHHINEVVSHIRDTTFRDPMKFNPPKNLICLENGVLDLGTLKLTPHSPDLIFLNKIPASYDTTARALACGKHFREWMSEDDIIRTIQFVGFLLYRDYFIRKACIVVGGGGNGKTTFLTWLTCWIGEENVSSVPVQDIDRNRFAASRFYGKLGNFCDDLPGAQWFQTGRFKQATGGAPMQMEMKFHDPFDAYNHAKMLFTANVLPLVTDDSRAFWERIMLMLFSNRFDGSRPRAEILEEMLTPKERSGILNAALAGLRMLRREGEFYKPESLDRVRSNYIHLSDPVAAFAENRIAEDPESREPKEQTYSEYVRYCRERGASPVINSVFSKLLRRAIPSVREARLSLEGKQTRFWIGIRFKTIAEIGAARDEKPAAAPEPKACQGCQDIQVISYSLYDTKEELKGKEYIGKNLDTSDTPTSFDFTALPSLHVFPHAEYPISPPTKPPATISDLKRRIWDLFGRRPFKPSEIPGHFSDADLVRVSELLERMIERGEAMVVPIPESRSERGLQLVGRG